MLSLLLPLHPISRMISVKYTVYSFGMINAFSPLLSYHNIRSNYIIIALNLSNLSTTNLNARQSSISDISTPLTIQLADLQHHFPSTPSEASDHFTDFNFNLPHSLHSILSINVFTITIPSSIRDFWNSNAYELAIAIGAASLVWPYIKLLLLLIIWWYPLPQNRRTTMTLVLDQLGKWSYMDMYASVVMTVCFYVHTAFHVKHLGTKSLTLDIRIVCEPDLGIVCFVIANLLSMALSHLFIYWDQHYGYHHHVQLWRARTRKEFEIENTVNHQPPKYKVSGLYTSFHRLDVHQWKSAVSDGTETGRGSDGSNASNCSKFRCLAALYRTTSCTGVVILSVFLLSLIATLWLIIETIFSVPARFVIGGVAGLVLGSPDNVRELNPIQTADGVITSTDKYGNAMLLCICYWITIIIFPIITQCVIIAIWLCPLKYSHFVWLLKSLWFVQAWNALDVFFVGSVSGAIAMEMVSKWIIDSTYPGVCGEGGLIEEWTGMGCFEVKGTITRGSWMSGAAALWQWISIWFTLRTAADIGVHGIEY